ncbi:MAG: AAA family ATPase [Pirellulales bacterium]|nr:AAA family ATPase [Pirellulales bacterium]
MKIKSLEVDGFGVWSKLKLGQLGDGIHVFHGPNEAGKTTLMQFLRSMFFGFSPERRRYLPPVHGGRPGGAVELAASDGSFRLARHDDDQSPGPRGAGVLSAPDGTRHGDAYVQSLLGGTDEATFNNVFSVGLREIQELATLDGIEAASLLFSLTAGLDRVSLVEAMGELANSRRRLLDNEGRTGQIADLAVQRDQLRRAIDELDGLTTHFGQLTTQHDALSRDAERLEQERADHEREARLLETAISLRERWARRGSIDVQLAELDVPAAGLEEAFEQFDRVDARVTKLRKRIGRFDRRRRQIRRRAAAVKINQPLYRQAARIEAFREQEGWIASLRAKVAELENQSRQLEEETARRREQLGLDTADHNPLPTSLGRTASAELRRLGPILRRRREALAEARLRLDERTEAGRAQAAEIQSALAARSLGDLNEAIEATGNLTSQLRRRVQLDGRIEQLERSQDELDQRERELLGRQILPLPVVVGLGAVFVFSVIMIAAGVFLPSSIVGSLGWPLLILGVGGVLVTFGMKIVLERSNSAKLDACQQRIHMLQQQITQANEERAALDRSLPPAASREAQLEAAEKSLAELEQLLPLDARRQAAEHETAAARLQVEQATSEFQDARRQWSKSLARAGLPRKLSPKNVRKLLAHRRQWAAMARQSEQVASELRLRQSELDAMRDRVTELATSAGVAVDGANPLDLLRRLSEELRREEGRMAQRKELLANSRRLRRRRTKLDTRLRPLRQRRRRCLERLGARDGDELRRKRASLNQAVQLQRLRQTLSAEIEAALAGQCSENELAACLAGASDEQIEARWDAISRQIEAIRNRIDQCAQQRGQIKAQLAELAEDRRGARKRLELGTVEARLASAVRRWRLLTLTERILADVKHLYETQRQPETLQEASEYLRRLTGGHYVRVWTPLGEDVLRVDDARGEVLPIEVLSQGTREQLFLALRLALVACYGRRGIRLPLVLDDVLVNCDTPRAKAAATLLRDFAGQDRQIFLFTCHDHILALFKSLGVDVRRLPNHRDTALGRETAVAAPKPKRSKKHAKRRQHKQGKHAREFDVEEEMAAWVRDDPDEDAPLGETEMDEDDEATPWEDAQANDDADEAAA